ncbi:endonuclease 8-like 1 isoform X3 [Acomys russatus]|uniref:endonuclease 8-like 1 isoform X3 n=1 Tax=Acomys russatus TaxID=60746 RepID=UPI0021E33D25|nr:endonuclease 8-like 1 isoform X3 [Acomys russatus]
MPEGPELHLASHFVNEACKGLVFGGCVEKSSVSRNPEVPFESSAYQISALARGKELRLTLNPLPGAQPPQKPLSLVFRFDIRRFGHWDSAGEWQAGRGPCVLLEYERFRENVLRNLSDKAFDRPICEALLDQRFFNGIGNYLRAEILYRLKIPPFEKARTVLEALQHCRLSPELTLSQKIKAKLQNPDLLELCHLVPKEVVQLGGKGYGPERGEEDFAAFRAWLRCYGVPGMSSLRDRQGRTIWFQIRWTPELSSFPFRVIPDPWHPKGADPEQRSHRKHSWMLRTEKRTVHFQASPFLGLERPGNTLLRIKLNSLKGPASNKTWNPLQPLRREREGGDRQPQVAADPQRVRLIPEPGRLGDLQPHK